MNRKQGDWAVISLCREKIMDESDFHLAIFFLLLDVHLGSKIACEDLHIFINSQAILAIMSKV